MADAVSSADSAGPVTYVGNTTSSRSTSLTADTSTFLKLLVAQLQYQDPLEPQTDTAFVTQLAQMTSVEQLQQMNEALSSSQAFNMIGKYAYAEVLNEKTSVTDCYFGKVDSIIIKDGEVYVVMGEKAIPISDVLQVYDESVVSDTSTDSKEASETTETTDTDSEVAADSISGDETTNTM